MVGLSAYLVLDLEGVETPVRVTGDDIRDAELVFREGEDFTVDDPAGGADLDGNPAGEAEVVNDLPLDDLFGYWLRLSRSRVSSH